MKKQTVINSLKEFPKEFKLEELLERLVFIEKIQNGIEQVKSGKTLEHTKVVKRYRNKHNKNSSRLLK